MKASTSRSALVRAACETGQWLEAEAKGAPASAPAPTTAVTNIDLSHQHLTRSSLSLLPPTLTCVDLSRCGLDGVGPLRRLPRLEYVMTRSNQEPCTRYCSRRNRRPRLGATVTAHIIMYLPFVR